MDKRELLQRSLYSIAKYDFDTTNYIHYNKLLWSNIQGLDNEAIEEALIQLTEANL
jgi:hypothetical protein